MSKRKYTKIEILLPEIERMLSEGKSQREIEQYFGLEGDRPVHNLLKRQRKKQQFGAQGLEPKAKGRPRKDGQSLRQSQQKEIEHLRMENKLLRDFLQSAGRK